MSNELIKSDNEINNIFRKRALWFVSCCLIAPRHNWQNGLLLFEKSNKPFCRCSFSKRNIAHFCLLTISFGSFIAVNSEKF